jgi:hypothetical protein
MGLRAAFIHQHYDTHYNVLFLPTQNFSVPTPATSTLVAQSNYWGVGLRGGANLAWHLSNHWRMWGQLSASILYGQYNIDEKFVGANEPQSTGGVTPIPVNFKDKIDRIRTNLQTAVGFGWETSFNNERQHLTINAGYEFLEWFDQTELLQMNLIPQGNGAIPSPETQEKNLGMQGLTVNVRFDF